MKTHQDCEHCGHKGCVTDFGDRTYCHSEGKTRFKEKDDAEMTHTELKETTSGIRGIDKDVNRVYNITLGISPNGDAIYHKYPYPHKDKFRYLPKDFSKNKGFTNDHLFGMDKFNAGSASVLTVVEGELDAASAYQMLGKKWPVVSLPNASVSSKLLKNCHEYMDSFKHIALCLDNDEAGQNAATKLASAFPGKVYKVNLSSAKDANEFLQKGLTTEFRQAWTNREKYVPSGVFNTSEQFKQILRDTEENTYIETPISEFNDLAKGLMQGHLTVLTGPEGQGKTEVLRLLEHNILKNHKDTPIAVLHMEESKKQLLTTYACYELGQNLRDPDHGVAQGDIEDAIADLTKEENLYVFDFGIDEEPLDILDKVRYFSEVCGCKYVFIDPIQQLSYGREGLLSEEQVLSRISTQLERLATEFNVGIVLTAHVNDDGQTRSSRMIGKSASVRVDLQRDHMNPDPDIRNVTKLSVSKNRPVGPTGYAGQLVFDHDTFTLKELL